jgi:hypothetical protein
MSGSVLQFQRLKVKWQFWDKSDMEIEYNLQLQTSSVSYPFC